MGTADELILANAFLVWRLDWRDGRLRSAGLENRLTGRAFPLSAVQEVGLVFSADPERLAEPCDRVTDFAVRAVDQVDSGHAVFQLGSDAAKIEVRVHYQLDGPTRRKWVEVENRGAGERLLLDVELDRFAVEAAVEGGGPGQPVMVGEEVFAAVEHPAGLNQLEEGRVELGHCPGRRLSPGECFRSHVALVSVAAAGQALAHFVAYIQERSVRRKGFLSVYTPFGINNQWGACPTLDDEQTLDVLQVLENWQRQGLRFDYFTLDTGWADFNSDLTRFRPTCYPNGPQQVVERIRELGMKLGLWFATSWGTQSCWDYPPAYPDQRLPGLPYREGYPETLGGITFCLGWEPYFRLLRDAILYHIREHGVRFIKLDGGSYYCDSEEHGHLPGKYSVEAMYERLIEIARSARAAAPDVFVMWYWGLRSPFWALHGDSIFESGLHMEGSGTSAFPALYYRDSVTLAQDQNARHARTIPPLVKDSLGVWLADTRWGNFMGKERWRESLVMDLGRGNMLFPNLWGNVHYLNDADVGFLARLSALVRKYKSLFLQRRALGGDPWKNEVYGYAYCQRTRGFLFLNNAHFAGRRAEFCLDGSLGLEGKPGARLQLVSHFPEPQRLLREDGEGFRRGDWVEVWLRPFEVLMLEVAPGVKGVAALPVRAVFRQEAEGLGKALALRSGELAEGMEVRFAEGERFAGQGLRQKVYAFAGELPELAGPQPILAVVVRLRQGEAEWRHSPTVVEIVQALVRIGDQNVQLIPVPDGRQYGNTQKAGCSWVVYRTRLGFQMSRAPFELAVHAWLPEEVEARVEAWVVGRWWDEDARPTGDGYYTYAPS